MDQRFLCAIVALSFSLQVSGLHHFSDEDDEFTLRTSRRSQASQRPDIWLRPGMKKARHLRVTPSAMEDFPEAFDWDTRSFSSVPEVSDYKMSGDDVLEDTGVVDGLDHELVKLNAYCRNVRRVWPYSRNVGTRNVSGCAAHVKSTRGCGGYFAYGFADGWCDCIEAEAGACHPSDYVTYNVYRLKGLPKPHVRPVQVRPKHTAHLIESPQKLTARVRQEPVTTPEPTFQESLNESTAEYLNSVSLDAEGDLTVFCVALGFNIVMASLCCLCFSCCRKNHPIMFNHNAMIDKVPSPSTTFAGWIQDSLRLTSEEVARYSGLDQAMFLEYTTLVLKMLVVIGLPMCLIMAPCHMFLGGGAAGDDKLSWQGMANIDASDSNGVFLLWVHCFIPWAVVIISQLMIFNAMGSFMGRRWAWMKSMPEPRCSSVMVEQIPPYLNTDKKLKDYFNRTFSRNVVAESYVVKYTKDLKFLCERMRNYQKDLADAEQKYRKTQKRPELKTWFDEKHDAISYWQDMIQDTVSKIYAERARIRSIASGAHSEEVCSFSGFVTFNSVQDAATAMTLNYAEDGDSFSVSAPPDPTDVIYTDLVISPGARRFQEFIGYFWLLVIFLLFIPLVGFITYFANMSRLEEIYPSVTDFVSGKNAFVKYTWNAILGALALTVAMSYVPILLGFIFNGWFLVRARSLLQQRLQQWSFAWTFFYVLIVASVGGLLITAVKMTFTDDEPFAVFKAFAVVVPLTSHFYFNYIMMQWSACAFDFSRWVNVTKFMVYRLFNEDAIARVKAEPEDPDYHGIGARSARATLFFTVVLVFCQISPIMCLLGLVLFASMRIYYGYLIVYTESLKPDLGGAFWVTQLKQTQLGVFLYILLMAGVLFERAPSWGPCAVALASLLPMLWAYFMFDYRFRWEQLPVEGLVDKEAATRRRESVRHSYEQPEMCEPLPDYSGHFPMPSTGKTELMDDFGCGMFKACGTHPTENVMRPSSA
mmetsp:Transcript_46419/g.81673  ORF Transcript_46419/g.81673 Transcript_46419/m.81673 type:complete len:984 (-) Transcript_46419:66-3017(-)